MKKASSGPGRFFPGITLLVLLAIALWPRGPGARVPLRQRRFLMDTLVTITAYPPAGAADGHARIEAALERMQEIEAIFTGYRDSPLRRWNDGGRLERSGAPPELLQALERVRALHRASGGNFDPSLGRLKAAWGFLDAPGEAPRPPSPEVLEAARAASGMDHLEDTPEAWILRGGARLDLGGWAKGLAVDAAVEFLGREGYAALVDAGGDMACTGPKPDGSPWKIGIRDPEDPRGLVGVIPLSEGAVATSGSYERYFEFEGRRYHHLLDPRTGEPAGYRVQATVLAPNCAAADAWATAFFVAPPEAVPEISRENQVPTLLVEAGGKRTNFGDFPPPTPREAGPR